MKFQQKLFYVILGALLATGFSKMGVPVFAAQIEAAFNTVNISIDGSKVAKVGENYALENGTEVPYSISYKGTTYLPMRKLSELLGFEIRWHDASRVVDVVTATEGKSTSAHNNITTSTSSVPNDNLQLPAPEKSFRKSGDVFTWYQLNGKVYNNPKGNYYELQLYTKNDDSYYVQFNPTLYIKGDTDVRVEGPIVCTIALVNNLFRTTNENSYIDGTIESFDMRPYDTIGMKIEESTSYAGTYDSVKSYTYTYNGKSLNAPNTTSNVAITDGVKFEKYNDIWLVDINDFLKYFNINKKISVTQKDGFQFFVVD